jgi:hypothetical protein
MLAKTITAITLVLTLVFGVVGTSLAAGNPNGTGQPNQSCEESAMRPGNAISAPGSAFNPTGTAGKMYAGQQPQNSNNPNSVSQYDVACFQVSQPHP